MRDIGLPYNKVLDEKDSLITDGNIMWYRANMGRRYGNNSAALTSIKMQRALRIKTKAGATPTEPDTIYLPESIHQVENDFNIH